MKILGFHGSLFKIDHAHFFSRVKIGPIDHARFHAQFFCPNWSRVNFCCTGAFLGVDHWWVVKVSRGKKDTVPSSFFAFRFLLHRLFFLASSLRASFFGFCYFACFSVKFPVFCSRPRSVLWKRPLFGFLVSRAIFSTLIFIFLALLAI